ncbi:hypothetical protein QUF07_02385 [Lentilactobacillus sp. TOM.63]|nr:hypothetical protein [Lentilactobacillus sp. TOM.63]MDM7515553.1 hypothetical protein [Lentilactobacillus sp. TOM.63]
MVVAIFMAFLMVNVTSQASTSREQGVNWSKYNGNSGTFGYSTDYKAITGEAYVAPTTQATTTSTTN